MKGSGQNNGESRFSKLLQLITFVAIISCIFLQLRNSPRSADTSHQPQLNAAAVMNLPNANFDDFTIEYAIQSELLENPDQRPTQTIIMVDYECECITVFFLTDENEIQQEKPTKFKGNLL